MIINKGARKLFASTGLACLMASGVTAQDYGTANLVFVVDESGSMGSDQTFLGSIAGQISTGLTTLGFSAVNFGLVGFGGDSDTTGHVIDVGSTSALGSASEFTTATGLLVQDGYSEDGYAGIATALNGITLDSNDSNIIILVSDEDRDIEDASLDFASILAALTSAAAKLMMLGSADVYTDTGDLAVATDGTTAFVQDGASYTETTYGYLDSYDTTEADYADLAFQTGGMFANLDVLRAGGDAALAFAEVLLTAFELVALTPSVSFAQSLVTVADDTAIAADQQQAVLASALRQGGFVAAGQNRINATFAAGRTGQSGAGSSDSRIGSLSYGYGLNDTVSVGFGLGFTGGTVADTGFDIDRGTQLGLWTNYSAGGAEGTGLQGAVSVGWLQSDATITRGRLMSAGNAVAGEASLDSFGASAQIGYGLALEGGWLVTPSATLAHLETRRGAYTETGATSVINYDAATVESRSLTLAFNARYAVGDTGRLKLGGGVVRTSGDGSVLLTGTSDIASLATFEVAGERTAKDSIAFAEIGYTHTLSETSSVSGDLRVSNSRYGGASSASLGVTYSMGF